MSENDLRMLMEQFDRLRVECDTPEKASAQLQKEGLLDEKGQIATPYRESETSVWQ
ncbi:MAG: hypothetical protein JSS87_01895 [Acidobacteria bacterium]|nr:hypothetical protein [Acidobacteriota bacterium]